jgi:hypothetical protein
MVALMAKFVSIHRSIARLDRTGTRVLTATTRPKRISSTLGGIGVDASLGAIDGLYISGTRGRDGRGVYETIMVVCGLIASHRLVRRAGRCAWDNGGESHHHRRRHIDLDRGKLSRAIGPSCGRHCRRTLYITQGDSSPPVRWGNTITKISFLSLSLEATAIA